MLVQQAFQGPAGEGQRVFGRIRHRVVGAAVAGLFAAGAVAPACAQDEEPDFLTFQVGAFDLIQDEDLAASMALEYRSNLEVLFLKPFGGLMLTTDGTAHGYAGVMLDIFFGRRVVLTFGFAPGIYIQGGGKDLGSFLEFRSSGELAFRFDDRSRLGLMVNYISNASIGSRNPGTEVLMLSYSVPFDKLF